MNTLHASRDLLFCLRLLEHVGMAKTVIPSDVVGSTLST